jgi:hypothetical protein
MASAVAALVLVLAACGDDDGDDVNDDAPVDTTRTADIPEIEGPITGPGDMAMDPLEPLAPTSADDLGYIFEEYFVSGTAADEPYRARVLVARPGEDADVPFSGHVLVEAKHPAGVPFIWSFTRDYLMSQGHAAVEISIFPGTLDPWYRGANPERYEDLHLLDEQADDAPPGATNIPAQGADIYAQVGVLLKSDETPLPGTRWLHFTGHSMSAGPVWHYMDTRHDAYRLEDGDPIYDAFFPETTRTASRFGPFPDVDVPAILINSELEVEAVIVEGGIDYRKPDSDEPGEQFRLYEVAGMPHNPTWMLLGQGEAAADLCENPLNSFPYNPVVSMAFDHLIRWVEDGVPPPRAEPIALTGEPGDADVAVERDQHGNALGGVRSTTLDVPVAAHTGVNQPLDEDNDLSPGSCEVYGSQLDFSVDELEDLYRDHGSYVDQVDGRLDELLAEGWFLEQFADDVRQAAGDFEGFGN